METFNELVQALPPEIFNYIYDLTFTTPSKIIYVDEEYQLPALLTVSRSTREKFKASYYSKSSIFFVDYKVLSKWIVTVADSEVKGETRMTKKFLRFSSRLGALSVALRVINEVNQQRIHTKGLVDRFLLQLRFGIAFGTPEKKAWLAISDLKDFDASGAIGEEWCERLLARDSLKNEDVA